MKQGGIGGGNTKVGLKFEQRTDIKKAFRRVKGYTIKNNEVYFKDVKVAELYGKYDLYTKFLSKYKINWKEIMAKKLLPDEGIFVLTTNTMYIIEKKFQHGPGSVDEKLQTCHFKLLQYKKLLSKTGVKVKYCYILNDWFKKTVYKDVLKYIKYVDCFYYFEELPFDFLRLPKP
jgi:hypothetical protein